MAIVIAFVVLSKLTVGVKVPVQVTPPLELASVVKVPLATVTSLLSKPVTASENVMVTSDVSPALRASSAIVIETTDGATVSTDTVAGEAAVVPGLPAASDQLATEKLIVAAAVLTGGVNVAV